MRRCAIYARLGAGVMLITVWGLVDSPLSGVAFVLALSALSAIRYRFSPFPLLIILEAVCCIGYAFMWAPALLGLWLPAIGLLEKRWTAAESELLKRNIEDRAELLKLEAFHEGSETDARSAARYAEMAERSRIAQDIHDHVGHEISGAALALQTAIKLYEKNDGRAGEVLRQTADRLDSAAGHLRETVHNLKPALLPGAWILEELCDSFSFCAVDYTSSGDFSGFSHWELLAANLKETLTNVTRHSDATVVTVRLDGNAGYVRMIVTDNGNAGAIVRTGLGLSGMKERMAAIGGSLTINTVSGFQVVCVLPKEHALRI